jgi:hypothetical protein
MTAMFTKKYGFSDDDDFEDCPVQKKRLSILARGILSCTTRRPSPFAGISSGCGIPDWIDQPHISTALFIIALL